MFVVLEGMDGAGTTTQLKLVSGVLSKMGKRVWITWEPTWGPAGRLIREYLSGLYMPDWRVLGLLFAADRLDHLRGEILPHLQNGDLVLCDRYRMSSLVYQGCGVKEQEDWISQINSQAIEPDLTVLLDIDPKLALRRIDARNSSEPEKENELFENLEKLTAVRSGYLGQIAKCAGVTVDGSRSVDEVTDMVVRCILERSGSNATDCVRGG